MEKEPLKIAIVGLGYVGLTLAVSFARNGLKVFGIEKRKEVVDLTNNGIPHFSEAGLDAALKSVVENGTLHAYNEMEEKIPPCDFYVITVGTPLLKGTHTPRLDMIRQATEQVASHMQDGATVILRSTVQIGTTRNIVKPVLDATGKQYYLAMCPERTLEGRALRELSELPQIIGGIDGKSSTAANSLFSLSTKTTIIVSSPETAEMIKLVDNTSRDVRFGFANEIARACVALGIDAYEVIRCGKIDYPRTNVALPGLVGGPCLEKDPHILMYSLKPTGIELEITKASRLVNERQPSETVDEIAKIAAQKNIRKPYTVALLGLAFKGVPATNDLRGSMSLKIYEEIERRQDFGSVNGFDPVIGADHPPELPPAIKMFDNIKDAIKGADIAIIANNHPFFSKFNIDFYRENLSPNGFVYDYWNNLNFETLSHRNQFYYSVGNVWE